MQCDGRCLLDGNHSDHGITFRSSAERTTTMDCDVVGDMWGIKIVCVPCSKSWDSGQQLCEQLQAMYFRYGTMRRPKCREGKIAPLDLLCRLNKASCFTAVISQKLRSIKFKLWYIKQTMDHGCSIWMRWLCKTSRNAQGTPLSKNGYNMIQLEDLQTFSSSDSK